MSGNNSKSQVKEAANGITYDRHGDILEDSSLKGLQRHFNSTTVRGRANVAKATVFGILGFVVCRKVSKAFGDSKTENPHDFVIKTEAA